MDKAQFFRRVFLVSRYLRELTTPSGRVVLGLTVFAAAFGVDPQANLAHMVFSLGFSLLVVDALAVLVIRHRAPQLEARRSLPEFVTATEPARYRIELRNASARLHPSLHLAERLRQAWPSTTMLEQARGAPTGNRFDQRVGYPTFIDTLRRLRAVDVVQVAVPTLLPGQSLSVDLTLKPAARGLAVFEQLHALVDGPLGLVQVRQHVTVGTASLPVLPLRIPVELPQASSRRQLQPGGISLAQRVGDAEEFRSLRDYRAGDPLRSIHWRSFARTGKPMVREMQEEFFARHALVLDCAAPSRFAPAFETAISMAAWLVARPLDADSLLDLMFVGDRVHRLTAGRGLGGSDVMLRVLAALEPTPTDSIEVLMQSVQHHAAQVSSVVVILLAWDAPRQQAMRSLLANGVQLTVLVVGDIAASASTEPDEKTAEFAGLLRWVVPIHGAIEGGQPAVSAR